MTLDEAIKHAEEVADYDCYNEKQFKCAEDHRQLAEWLKELKQLRAHVRWIPVSERLPEESLNSVIGWDAYRERCVFVQYIDGYFQITGSDESFDIVAWMPLPTPYKAESEDKE